MKLLVIGNSAREDAIGYCLQKSDECEGIFFAPGNAGTAERGQNVDLKPTDIAGLTSFAEEEKIGLTIVGGEEPLPLGIVDEFRSRKMNIFGPTKAAARIETSKKFSKALFNENGVPTAAHRSFSSYTRAVAYLEKVSYPVVVKASGLAAGKGSRICRTPDEAALALHDFMIRKIFGDNGSTVVIEEFLYGRESSVHVIADIYSHQLINTAWQDHKYLNAATDEHPEGTGPMTGGMGTYSPVPWMTDAVMRDIDQTFAVPILEGLRKKRSRFTGCLFPGLITMPNGWRKILEANARLGAPETESLARNFENMLETFDACARNKLDTVKIQMGTRAVVSLVLASGGYPGKYPTGHRIVGIEKAKGNPNVEVFHAGTVMREGKPVTNGGRVLTVSATGKTLAEAQKTAYAAADKIKFLDPTGRDTKYVRPDIGHQGLNYQP